MGDFLNSPTGTALAIYGITNIVGFIINMIVRLGKAENTPLGKALAAAFPTVGHK